MDLLGADERTGKLLCSIQVELGGVTGGFALRAESAYLWHRRMGHINRRSMDVLRKLPGNGIKYTGDIQACDVCAVGKSNQQAHPKQATYDVQHAFKLVTVDLMDPITLPCLEAIFTQRSSSINTPSGGKLSSSRRKRKPSMLSSCSTRRLWFLSVPAWFVSGRIRVRSLRVLSFDSIVWTSVSS